MGTGGSKMRTFEEFRASVEPLEHQIAQAQGFGPGAMSEADWSTLSQIFGSIRVSQRYFGAFRDFSGFSVDDLMGKALWKLVENAQRFPRCGGRVLCVHGAGSFHRAHPYATRSPRPRTAVDP